MISASKRVRPTAAKSTPRPGTTSMPLSRSAKLLSPRPLASAIASDLVIPAGNCRPITPLNSRSVACPRTRGPITESATPPSDNANTPAIAARCARSRRSRRRAEAAKSRDRMSPGSVIAAGPRRIGGAVTAGLPPRRLPPGSRRTRGTAGSDPTVRRGDPIPPSGHRPQR